MIRGTLWLNACVLSNEQQFQTGKYVARAEDLPRASKLPCAQRLIKRAKFGKYTAKIYNYVC